MRDWRGEWITGFFGKIICAEPLRAEFEGIFFGLLTAKDRGWKSFNLESDCKTAVDMINEGDWSNHPHAAIILDCREMKTELNADVTFIPREANQCADWLAKYAKSRAEEFFMLDDPPGQLRQIIDEERNRNQVENVGSSYVY